MIHGDSANQCYIMAASVQDGPYAWLLCTACFFNITLLGGFILTTGVFYIMFKECLDATDSEVSLITSINVGVMHIVCPFVGMLSERYGVRCVSMIGAFLSTVGMACAAFSFKIYHLYLSYGLISGLGLGMVMNCSVCILDPYFRKYKRTACGLATTGFGVGSFIFPPILKMLEDIYGWRGAILLLAGMSVHMMLTSALFRPFTAEPSHEDYGIYKQNGAMIDKSGTCRDSSQVHLSKNECQIKQSGLQDDLTKFLSLFKNLPFFCLITFTVIYVWPLGIILTHFGAYLLTIGFSGTDVVELYMAFGITSTIARPFVGVFAQVTKANAASFIMLTQILNGLLTLCVPLMNQLWMFYLYAILFQILITPYNCLQAVYVMENVPKPQVAVAFGIVMMASVPGYTMGGPFSAWLYDYTHVYAHSFLVAGAIWIFAGLTLGPASYYIHKRKAHKEFSTRVVDA